MNNNFETNVSALLEADRKKNLGRFRTNSVLEQKLVSSTPRKATLETVYVEFTPSGMIDVYADSWFVQVNRVFRGHLRDVRPVLTGEDEQDRVLFGRYLETIFWRKMVSINREYKVGSLQRTVDDFVKAPALFTNAVNCIGIVTVNNLALRLVPKFADDFDWRGRLLSDEEFVQVAEWISELMDWGFQAYEGFNSQREGNLDFMLMTVAEEDAVGGVEADITLEEGKVAKAGEGRTCRFVIKSQRAASNITALYRYFFHNKKIEYLSDTRLTYSYSDFDATADAVDYIVEKMIWENKLPSFLAEAEFNQNVQKKKPEMELQTAEDESQA